MVFPPPPSLFEQYPFFWVGGKNQFYPFPVKFLSQFGQWVCNIFDLPYYPLICTSIMGWHLLLKGAAQQQPGLGSLVSCHPTIVMVRGGHLGVGFRRLQAGGFKVGEINQQAVIRGKRGRRLNTGRIITKGGIGFPIFFH